MLYADDERARDMAIGTTARRELAHRASSGIEVWLYWCKITNRVTVEVLDEQLDGSFQFEVEGKHALHAFNHPYAYAAARGVTAFAPASRRLAA